MEKKQIINAYITADSENTIENSESSMSTSKLRNSTQLKNKINLLL